MTESTHCSLVCSQVPLVYLLALFLAIRHNTRNPVQPSSKVASDPVRINVCASWPVVVDHLVHTVNNRCLMPILVLLWLMRRQAQFAYRWWHHCRRRVDPAASSVRSAGVRLLLVIIISITRALAGCGTIAPRGGVSSLIAQSGPASRVRSLRNSHLVWRHYCETRHSNG